MKKVILSVFTIGSFALYAIFLRGSNATNYQSEPATVTDSNTGINLPATTSSPNTETPATSLPAVSTKPKGAYNDGTYVGNSADAYYGYIQVEATMKNGLLSDVVFLDHPQDRNTSVSINNFAMPILKSEAIKAQSANVATVSGATDSSSAFRESLQAALAKAKS